MIVATSKAAKIHLTLWKSRQPKPIMAMSDIRSAVGWSSGKRIKISWRWLKLSVLWRSFCFLWMRSRSNDSGAKRLTFCFLIASSSSLFYYCYLIPNEEPTFGADSKPGWWFFVFVRLSLLFLEVLLQWRSGRGVHIGQECVILTLSSVNTSQWPHTTIIAQILSVEVFFGGTTRLL